MTKETKVARIYKWKDIEKKMFSPIQRFAAWLSAWWESFKIWNGW